MVFKKSTLLPGIATLALAGTASAGLIDISGQTSPGGPLSHTEGAGALTAIDFDIDFEAFSPSWSSEAEITLEHVSTATTFSFDGFGDFGWTDNSGVFSFTGSFAESLADASGTWEVTFTEAFDDTGIDPDGQYLAGSTITLVTTGGGTVPEPAPLALSLFGLAIGAGLNRRSKKRR